MLNHEYLGQFDNENKELNSKDLAGSLQETGQPDVSSVMQNKKAKPRDRELFVLPTSEIEDLYKELKEQDAVQNFGLIGRQPIMNDKNSIKAKKQNTHNQNYGDK